MTLFSTFHEIYSGCCTVAAHVRKSLLVSSDLGDQRTLEPFR
jgi:hypothetical protein